MIKFRQTAGTGGDETAPYDVIFDRQYTVREFIDYVLTRNEWGLIIFKEGLTSYEYKRTAILSPIADEVMDKRIVSVIAVGGWSNMDYFIEAK